MPKIRLEKKTKDHIKAAAAKMGISEDELANELLRVLYTSDIRAEILKLCQTEANGRQLTMAVGDLADRPRIYRQIDDFMLLQEALNG